MEINVDRELLQMAAKAVGIELHFGENDYPHTKLGGLSVCWNPLTDDGDALRLAVKLRMELDLSYPEARAKGTGGWVDIDGEPEDEYVDTRRAIVRAAAEIGRSMPAPFTLPLADQAFADELSKVRSPLPLKGERV